MILYKDMRDMVGLQTLATCLVVALALANLAALPRQIEKLGRGVVAVRFEQDKVFVGWRLLGTDVQTITFNVYRETNGGG